MTKEKHPDPVIISIEVEDDALADRLVTLLANVNGVRLVQAGEPADVALTLPGSSHHVTEGAPLTPRELEVLALLATGASNKTIAQRLGISVHTAKFHVGSLLNKLDATGRTDAVVHAVKLGVIYL